MTLCGELAGNPLAAMALAGLGYRSLSMSAAATAVPPPDSADRATGAPELQAPSASPGDTRSRDSFRSRDREGRP